MSKRPYLFSFSQIDDFGAARALVRGRICAERGLAGSNIHPAFIKTMESVPLPSNLLPMFTFYIRGLGYAVWNADRAAKQKEVLLTVSKIGKIRFTDNLAICGRQAARADSASYCGVPSAADPCALHRRREQQLQKLCRRRSCRF